MSDDFRILAAIDRETGAILRPHEGARGVRYGCPGCELDVVWRKCDDIVRRSHFAHLPGSACAAGESIIHRTAKLLVADDLRKWIEGTGSEPTLRVRCPGCGQAMPPAGIGEFGAIRGVHVERALASGLRPDVMVTDTPDVRTAKSTGAIEIMHSHPVDEEKAALLARDNVWWFELQAESVLEEQARGWRVLRASRRWPSCSRCLGRREKDVTARERETREWWERMTKREADSDAQAAKREADREKAMAAREVAVGERENAVLAAEQRLKEAMQRVDAPLRRREDDLRRLDEDIAARRVEIAEVTAKLSQRRDELAAVNADPLLADRRLIIGDIDCMHAKYKEMFDVAERLRCRKLDLEREVRRLEARLWAEAAPGQQ